MRYYLLIFVMSTLSMLSSGCTFNQQLLSKEELIAYQPYIQEVKALYERYKKDPVDPVIKRGFKELEAIRLAVPQFNQ